MNKRKKYLILLLVVLVALFFGMSVLGYFLVTYQKREEKELQRLDELADLKQAELDALTPTPGPTATPTPSPSATPTPTPVVERTWAFDPDDFWNTWYSTDGLASINIYQIDRESVGFSFRQVDASQSVSCEADVWAEIAGNAATFSFSDTYGNYAEGSMTFNGTQLYVRIRTTGAADGAPVSPSVGCVMVRNQPQIQAAAEPTATPALEIQQESQTAQSGDYIFAESGSRYLTDEELSGYSSSELELAKNEIYARRGRQFVTEYISDYFNSKSWYQGTIDPETFDAQQYSIFNEYELANIDKIAAWEEQKRSQGQ
jgi:hypothetical protein